MNTRTIVLILALLSLISTAAGGYLYYHSIQKAAVKGIDSNFVQATEDLKDDIARYHLYEPEPGQGHVFDLYGFRKRY